MKTFGKLTRLGFALMVAAPLACRDGSSPETSVASSFDAAATRAALEVMDRVFGTAPWGGFRVLGARPPAFAPAGSAVHGLVASVPRLPFEVRGKTFVFDPALGRYVPDSMRAGAPPNGVRFVLYAVDSLSGRPVVEQEIGYAEITDEGDALANGVALRLRVVAGGLTHLDYFVRAEGGETSGALAAAGWITDGSTRLQFDVGVAVSSAAESVAVRFAFGIPERGFAATGAMRNVGSDSGGVGELGLAVQVGADLIEVNARGDRSAIDALFRVNGLLFARVLGDPASPAIRGEGGRELTSPEMQALGGIVAMAGGVFGTVQSLLQPAGALLNLGTI